MHLKDIGTIDIKLRFCGIGLIKQLIFLTGAMFLRSEPLKKFEFLPICSQQSPTKVTFLESGDLGFDLVPKNWRKSLGGTL